MMKIMDAIFATILIGAIAGSVLMTFCLCKIAKQSDERAEKIMRQKEEKENGDEN